MSENPNLDEIKFIVALEYHLQNNLYPPQPLELVEPARQAIQAAILGEPDTLIDLAACNLTNKQYGDLIPARVLIEDLHLEDFINLSDQEATP